MAGQSVRTTTEGGSQQLRFPFQRGQDPPDSSAHDPPIHLALCLSRRRSFFFIFMHLSLATDTCSLPGSHGQQKGISCLSHMSGPPAAVHHHHRQNNETQKGRKKQLLIVFFSLSKLPLDDNQRSAPCWAPRLSSCCSLCHDSTSINVVQ